MTRLIVAALRLILGAALGILIVFVISVSIGRELLQDVDDFRGQIEGFIGEATGLRVHARVLRGAWIDMRPELIVSGLSVQKQEGERALFSAKQIKLQWLMFSSLANLEPRFKVWVDGAALDLVYKEGLLLPFGIDRSSRNKSEAVHSQSPEDNFRLIDYINRQPHLELSDSSLTIDGLWQEKALFDEVNLIMVNRGGYREINGNLRLLGAKKPKVQLSARTKGSISNLGAFNAHGYIKIDNISVVPWLPETLRVGDFVEIESARGAVEIWGVLAKGVVDRVTADLALENVVVKNTRSSEKVSLRGATGVIQYQRIDDLNAQVVLSDFHMEGDGFNWDPKLLSLNIEHIEPNTWGLDLLLDEVDIAPWVQYYIGLSDENSAVHEVLQEASPKGLVQELHARVLLSDGNVDAFNVTATLLNFEMNPYRFIPGVSNLSADIELSEAVGFVSLDSDDVVLDYPALFRSTLPVDWLNAQFKVAKFDNVVELESGLVTLNNAEIRTTTKMSMTIPIDGAISPRIQAQSTLRGIDASLTSKYLPAGVLPDGLTSFLDGSVIAGELVRGDIVFNGPLFDDLQEENLNMQLGFLVDAADFRFLPEWKPVKNAQADVVVDRVFVDAYAVAGNYYGASVEQALVTTRYEAEADPFRLSVKALVKGNASHGLDALQLSPLRSYLNGFIDEIELSGDLGLGLNLSLLLADEDIDLQVDVDADVSKGLFSMPIHNIQVSDINGSFTFDLSNGVRAENVTGKSFGGALSASIYPQFSLEDASIISTRIDTVGVAGLPSVADWLNTPLLDALAGTLPYSSALVLPMNASDVPYIEVSSTLKGVSVQLPEPFYKDKDLERNLFLKTTLGGDLMLFSLRYADLVNLSAEIDSSRLSKAAIVFGGVGGSDAASKGDFLNLPQEDGYHIRGHLSQFDLASWVNTFAELQKQETSSIKTKDLPIRIEESLLDGNLKVDELNVFGQRYPVSYFHFKSARDTWDVDISGEGVEAAFSLPKYLLQGNVVLADQQELLKARFPLLTITRPESIDKHEDNTVAKTQPSPIDPSELPPMELIVENFELDDRSLGRWEVVLKPSGDSTQNGMIIDPFNVQLDSANFSGVGSWLYSDEGILHSSLQGQVAAKDIAKVIKNWGGEPALDSDNASASIKAKWPGAPFEFDVLKAEAEMSVKIQDGHFLNVDSGAVDKVWGALNFHTIMKRLQLNFKDLSSSDLTFEEIEGNLKLNDQVLRVNEIKVDSTAVGMELAGDIQLEQQALAMELDVTIPVTRNLVLPAAAVGGLPAAATAYVIERVLGDQLNKLTTVKYDVSGTFESPVVQVKDTFNVIPKPLQDSILKTDDDAPKILQPDVRDQPGSTLEQGVFEETKQEQKKSIDEGRLSESGKQKGLNNE